MVVVNGNSTTHTFQIVIHPLPGGNFSYQLSPNGCAPRTATFMATGSPTNFGYTWTYGDNQGGSGYTSTHSYAFQGSFNPQLTITDPLTTCHQDIPNPAGPIHVSMPPTFQISTNPSPPQSCSAPLTVNFNGSASSPNSPISGGGLNFSWNFDNGQTSSSANPGNITFNTQGIYDVTITATDNNNCSGATNIQVSLVTPSLSVTFPSTVCIENQTVPHPTFGTNFSITVSSSQTSVSVNMGDGTPVFSFPLPLQPGSPPPQLSPGVPFTSTIHAYQTPGLKTVTVTASNGLCQATYTQHIMVEEIAPAFTVVPPLSTCNPSMLVNLINQSTVNTGNSMTYTWVVEPWENAPPYIMTPSPASLISNQANPSFVITQHQYNQYTYFGPYRPMFQMTVTSAPVGCMTLLNHTLVTIQRPTANYSMSTAFGCAPLTVTLTSTSITSVNTTFTQYSWTPGAPFSPTSGATSSLVTLTFTAPGVYTPTLTVTNSQGCSNSAAIGTIQVSAPPVPSLQSISSNQLCAGATATLVLAAPPPSPQHWHITTDAGFFSSCVNSPTQIGVFNNPGVHNITVTAMQNNCEASSVALQTISVSGPAAKIRYTTNCSNKYQAVFSYTLIDASSATLDFGDQSPTVPLTGTINGIATGTVAHTYASVNNYTAELEAFRSPGVCLPRTYSTQVFIQDPIANIQLTAPNQTIFCKSKDFTISASPYNSGMTGCGEYYVWYFDNSPPVLTGTNTVSHVFHTVGTHTVKLRVKDINGCEDTDTKTLRITQPVPAFSFSNNPYCYSDFPVMIINSTNQVPDPIQTFYWAFSEPGIPFPASGSVMNTAVNISHTFNPIPQVVLSQTYSVRLAVVDLQGCIDSVRHTLTVNKPWATMVSSPNPCITSPLQTFTFTMGSVPNYSNYTINFGDGSSPHSSSQNIATHVYTATGVYNVSLTVTDQGSCKDQAVLTLSIQQAPTANFSFYETGTNDPQKSTYCLPFPGLTFTTNTSSSYPLMYFWNLGNGMGSLPGGTLASSTYTNPGTNINVSLYLLTLPASCSAIATASFSLYNYPKGIPEISKNPMCLGEPFTVTLKDPEHVVKWQWDFGDGVPTPTLTNTLTSLSYPYTYTAFPNNPNGTVAISLFASSDNLGECKISPTPTVAARVIQVLPSFMRNAEAFKSDSLHCLGIPDTFSNTTLSNASALSFTWSFGDGSGNNYQVSPQHIYAQPGTYQVQMKVLTTEALCEASATKNMTIFPNPSATLNVQDLACPDSLFLVSGAGFPGVSGVLTATLSSPLTSQTLNLAPNNSFTLQSSASATSVFSLTVLDDNACRNSPATDTIHIQLAPPVVNTSTTIIVGQTVTINGFVGSNYLYQWTQDTSYLSCTACYNPVSTTTNNITYTLGIIDQPLGCFEVFSEHTVIVRLVASIDVPTAFTPNGDGVNDFILPDGWGIRKLIYFKVFNRWGQLLFESNDLDRGWDGTFNGVPQNVETYIYQAAVDTYTDETLTKTGSFKLIR